MSEQLVAINRIGGRGLPLRGDDIDTDRIMPARFLVAVSFEGLERHLFVDDRAANPQHAFNDPRYRGASVLIVNKNFGCGSSREHAPQGLVRAGIRAIVGEGFSEIFRGNSAMLGMPCFTASQADVDRLQTLVESNPETMLHADVSEQTVVASGFSRTSGPPEGGPHVVVKASLPQALREAFLSGQWNPTAMLLDRFEEVRAVASRLPYIRGF